MQYSTILHEMTDKEAQFHTRISESVKTQWDDFIKNKHHRLKGAMGPELELAMINHMKNYQFIQNEQEEIYNTSTLNKLKIISNEFKEFPNPHIKPIVLRGLIKKILNCKDGRTHEKYMDIVTSQCVKSIPDGEIFPIIDVTGFCNFVEKLTQENSLK